MCRCRAAWPCIAEAVTGATGARRSIPLHSRRGADRKIKASAVCRFDPNFGYESNFAVGVPSSIPEIRLKLVRILRYFGGVKVVVVDHL